MKKKTNQGMEKPLRPHVIPNIEDWPIFKLSESRKHFVKSLIQFTIRQINSRHTYEAVNDMIAKTIYLERIRVKEDPWKVDPPNEKQYWKKLQKKLVVLRQLQDQEEQQIAQQALLEEIITRYTEEIVGTFHKRTFLFARWFLTLFFTRLLIAARTKRIFKFGSKKLRLSDRMVVKGEVDLLRKLYKKGTVVIVPTHFSNLDSILVGYAIDTFVGLPSFAYGAGLNLYNTGYTAYFMNRLGAYRVDRRKRNPIYLETLKGNSNLIIQRGVNSLFFPGGTRSRSGSLEKKLKLGLLGTTIEAQRTNYQEGENEKIFVVPLVLSYHFVLEAKYLIEQHLTRQGKEKYIRVKDEGNSIRKMLNFAWHSFSQTSDIILSFGEPMDVLGNPVDADGKSYDKYGNEIHLVEYFMREDEVVTDFQREAQYTTMLADRIVDRYHKDNIVLASHLVAFCAFEWLLHQNPKLDLYGLLRLPTEDITFDESALIHVVKQAQKKLFEMEGEGLIKLSDHIRASATEVIKDGIQRLGSYYVKKPIKVNKHGEIVSDSLKLLYFYHNRLLNYQLEQKIDWTYGQQ